MVKHTQRIRSYQQIILLSVFDHFLGLALEGLIKIISIKQSADQLIVLTETPVNNYLCKINGRNTRKSEIYSKLTINDQDDVIYVVLVILLLTLNMSHFFCSVYYCLWTHKFSWVKSIFRNWEQDVAKGIFF